MKVLANFTVVELDITISYNVGAGEVGNYVYTAPNNGVILQTHGDWGSTEEYDSRALDPAPSGYPDRFYFRTLSALDGMSEDSNSATFVAYDIELEPYNAQADPALTYQLASKIRVAYAEQIEIPDPEVLAAAAAKTT